MLIHHITLISGHDAVHRLDIIEPHAIAVCRSLLPDGGQIPNFSAFRVEIVGPAFTVFRGREPLVSCAVGVGPDERWQLLVDLQKRFAPIAVQDPKRGTRWLAVAILPPLALVARDDIAWLGDFERCMAAAMLLPQ